MVLARRPRSRLHALARALRAATAVGLVALCGACSKSAKEESLLVFAAASLRDALGDYSTARQGHVGRLEFNFGPSNALAQQIAAAPRADVFISASEPWMDHVERAGVLAAGTRRDLLGNRLVVVANAGAPYAMREPADLATLEYDHLALGDPKGVPAGEYAKAWLEQETREGSPLWDAVAPRVAPALDVRAALALVEQRKTVIGIVYATDARASTKVKVIYAVPEERSPRIRYPVAVIASRPNDVRARALLDDLFGHDAGEIFRRHGFSTLPAEEPAGR